MMDDVTDDRPRLAARKVPAGLRTHRRYKVTRKDQTRSIDDRLQLDRLSRDFLPTCYICGEKHEWEQTRPISLHGSRVTEARTCSKCLKAGAAAASEQLRRRAHELHKEALFLEEVANDLRGMSPR